MYDIIMGENVFEIKWAKAHKMVLHNSSNSVSNNETVRLVRFLLWLSPKNLLFKKY